MPYGQACQLYTTCKMCMKNKYALEFPRHVEIRNTRWAKGFYCRECHNGDGEQWIDLFDYPYNYDSTLLLGKTIKVRGRRKKGWFQYYLTIKRAKQLVQEGAASIVHPGLIHLLYNKKELRRLIIEGNHFICFYCGEYGDTIDHIIPKSKGGLTTPKNCVCACLQCNQLKNDLTLAEFLERHKMTNVT